MNLLRLIIFFAFAASLTRHSTSQHHQVRAGYWLSTSDRYSSLSSIDASLYSHLYYYSVSLEEANSSIALPPPEQLSLLVTFSTTVKTSNCAVKTILSVADVNHQVSSTFSAMARDRDLRSSFIKSSIELAREHSFDGLDLAWQFPSSLSDMANLGVLLAEWRSFLQSSHSSLLLTVTVYFSDHLFNGADHNLDYPVDAISRNVDWINVMCFDYHKNSMIAIADAPLRDKTSHWSANYGIGSWLDSGVPSYKIVMGIPLYGRSWHLKNKEKNEPGAQVVAAGPRQKNSNQSGVMAYFEIEAMLQKARSPVVYDDKTVSSYFYNGGLWVSFDSAQVVEEKIKFARKIGMLGYFLYPISFDNSNHSLSKQALDAWERYEDRHGEAPSPEISYQFEQAPRQSTYTSDSRLANIFIQCSGSPLFLLLYCVLSKV